ncbi:hypothetical protein [Domibacillus tundrae]|jgi:hypothetical protein|uniref:hypothetical protein n=1 Tax=Domibacillus tundrae TaxID=1587527 RepID=UPI000B30D606|nr:hypothetical protein [Domibacillus tundrae]
MKIKVKNKHKRLFFRRGVYVYPTKNDCQWHAFTFLAFYKAVCFGAKKSAMAGAFKEQC